MQMKQLTVEDWRAILLSNPQAFAQVRICLKRQALGMKLATWEQNCLIAAATFAKVPETAK